MPNDAPQRFREVTVVGGGCYGSFYAGQLAKALARGKLTAERILIVDRDAGCRAATLELGPPFVRVVDEWGRHFDRWLERPPPSPGEPDDAVVPSPLMPHLMAQWLARVAERFGLGVRTVPVAAPVGTPYDRLAPDGNRYVSFADWICPTHCIEPATCPAIRGPRTWEMADALEAYARRATGGQPSLGAVLFRTSHRAFGVGMFDLATAREARRLIANAKAAGSPGSLLVGTISSCHGATTMLEFTPG